VEILKNAGIHPAPRRAGATWRQFLRSQAKAILACDFFTADLLGGTQAYVLAVIEHATRRSPRWRPGGWPPMSCGSGSCPATAGEQRGR
jgi:hypothetical protein